jgi:cbb3-type cytochrome oxidase subunit 3
MRLSELIGTLSPTTYTLLALLLFVGVFAAISVRTFRASSRPEQEHARNLPLEDSHE